MTDSVQLGPFDLTERIGSGGMGVVYRGTHRETGLSVAVKVIQRKADWEAQRLFHEEVQAQAGLQHPGIVYLFEYGKIDTAAAEASGGVLREGDPFVAMELADHGTMWDAMPLQRWETVERVLVQVLDALAYAHARGVVHRDLKPENLLVFDAGDATSEERRVKLADFGVAHALGGEREAHPEELESSAGTPLYAPPEQLRGRWRRYGPWTDLYALGCIAWELLCGRPPFTGESVTTLRVRHERAPRPPLEPQFPVPDGVEGWIQRAMAPVPERRFRRAADAAWALSRATRGEKTLRETDPTEGQSRPAGDEANLTVTLQFGDLEEASRDLAATVQESSPPEIPSDDVGADGAFPSPLEANPPVDSDRPPVPESWRSDRTGSPPAPLVGAGLGLFGLREPPFVDRTRESERIWATLREAIEERSRRTVFISGDAGTGKSRLAEWMTTRAHEVGAAKTLRVVHTQGGRLNQGLPSALERRLRCVKMARGEVFEYLLETLPPLENRDENWLEDDARALTEYLRPTDDDADDVDGPAFQFSNPAQKHALVARTLERLARSRPVILWLDDLQWGDEALGLLEHLNEHPADELEILVLATLRSDLVAEQPRLESRLDELREEASAVSLELTPLSRRHQRQLLVELLPLEDELADTLAERTEGHPLFAMQLLGHWIEKEAIEVGPDGFRTAEHRTSDVPEDVHDLWQRRLDRFIGELDFEPPEEPRQALEMAAAFGRDVGASEWRGVCEVFDLALAGRIRDGLIERGLAERTDTGWTFAHGLFVASLEQQARDAGRWQDHHRRCAELLERMYPNRPKQTASRRAAHFVEAGETESALTPLLQEARRRHELGEYERAKSVLQRREGLLDSLEGSGDDPRRIENTIRLASVDLYLGASPESVLGSLEEARDRAERTGADRLLALAYRVISKFRRVMNEFDRAAEAAQRAMDYAESCGERTYIIDAMLSLGSIEFLRGRFDEAERQISEARDRSTDAGDRYRRLQSQRSLSAVALGRGEVERASTLYEETLEEARRAGYREIEMECVNGLGEIARFGGDADTARKQYRRYRRISEQLQAPETATFAVHNLGQVELMAGRFEFAERHLKEAERRFHDLSEKPQYLHVLKISFMVLAAGLEDWARFDDVYSAYADGWPEGARVIRDQPWLLELAGEYAAEAGERERAECAWRLAGELWDRLGDEEAANEISEKLA